MSFSLFLKFLLVGNWPLRLILYFPGICSSFSIFFPFPWDLLNFIVQPFYWFFSLIITYLDNKSTFLIYDHLFVIHPIYYSILFLFYWCITFSKLPVVWIRIFKVVFCFSIISVSCNVSLSPSLFFSFVMTGFLGLSLSHCWLYSND